VGRKIEAQETVNKILIFAMKFLRPLKVAPMARAMPAIPQISDFQPVFRGKLVFRERSSGVPQEI